MAARARLRPLYAAGWALRGVPAVPPLPRARQTVLALARALGQRAFVTHLDTGRRDGRTGGRRRVPPRFRRRGRAGSAGHGRGGIAAGRVRRAGAAMGGPRPRCGPPARRRRHGRGAGFGGGRVGDRRARAGADRAPDRRPREPRGTIHPAWTRKSDERLWFPPRAVWMVGEIPAATVRRRKRNR